MTPHQLGEAIELSLSDLVEEGRLPPTGALEPVRSGVRRPGDARRGDYACTTPLEVAAATGVPPREVAGMLRERLARTPGVESVEVAGPGFLNVTVSVAARLADLVRLLDEAPGGLARGPSGRARTPVPGWEPGGRADVGNPRYLVLLAHARAASLLRNAAVLGLAPRAPDEPHDPLDLPTRPQERLLAGMLVDLLGDPPADPPRLSRRLEEAATAFLGCQEAHPSLPVGDERPGALHAARLLLVRGTRVTLACGLASLGVAAPERM